MIGARDQKTDWNLGETIVWIRTRDHDRVARMWEMSEFVAIAFALFDSDQVRHRVIGTVAFDNEGRLRIAAGPVNASSGGPSPGPSGASPAQAEGFGNDPAPGLPGLGQMRGLAQAQLSGSDELARPDRILQEIMRRVQTGKVGMTMVRPAEARTHGPVSAKEAQELELRITEDAVAPVTAWSRTQGSTAGISPWFSRTDVIRAWPELSKKTAAVTGAILRHLREISRPEQPLIKPEALQRCLADVPNAYPAAFQRAWSQLEAAHKRGRGKHGPRAH
jgi:hypothetical protein